MRLFHDGEHVDKHLHLALHLTVLVRIGTLLRRQMLRHVLRDL
jgi:hypothetical protein